MLSCSKSEGGGFVAKNCRYTCSPHAPRQKPRRLQVNPGTKEADRVVRLGRSLGLGSGHRGRSCQLLFGELWHIVLVPLLDFVLGLSARQILDAERVAELLVHVLQLSDAREQHEVSQLFHSPRPADLVEAHQRPGREHVLGLQVGVDLQDEVSEAFAELDLLDRHVVRSVEALRERDLLVVQHLHLPGVLPFSRTVFQQLQDRTAGQTLQDEDAVVAVDHFDSGDDVELRVLRLLWRDLHAIERLLQHAQRRPILHHVVHHLVDRRPLRVWVLLPFRAFFLLLFRAPRRGRRRWFDFGSLGQRRAVGADNRLVELREHSRVG
eukprot:2449183-Rhodomonas_salina.1